jgi:hypothetical protein
MKLILGKNEIKHLINSLLWEIEHWEDIINEENTELTKNDAECLKKYLESKVV